MYTGWEVGTWEVEYMQVIWEAVSVNSGPLMQVNKLLLPNPASLQKQAANAH